MADKYGTDCGVKGMKNYLHIFIKDLNEKLNSGFGPNARVNSI